MAHLKGVAKFCNTGFVCFGYTDGCTLKGFNDVLVDHILTINRDFLPTKGVDELVAVLCIFCCVKPSWSCGKTTVSDICLMSVLVSNYMASLLQLKSKTQSCTLGASKQPPQPTGCVKHVTPETLTAGAPQIIVPFEAARALCGRASKTAAAVDSCSAWRLVTT